MDFTHGDIDLSDLSQRESRQFDPSTYQPRYFLLSILNLMIFHVWRDQGPQLDPFFFLCWEVRQWGEPPSEVVFNQLSEKSKCGTTMDGYSWNLYIYIYNHLWMSIYIYITIPLDNHLYNHGCIYIYIPLVSWLYIWFSWLRLWFSSTSPKETHDFETRQGKRPVCRVTWKPDTKTESEGEGST